MLKLRGKWRERTRERKDETEQKTQIKNGDGNMGKGRTR